MRYSGVSKGSEQEEEGTSPEASRKSLEETLAKQRGESEHPDRSSAAAAMKQETA